MDATLDEIMEFLKDFGEVKNVVMRRSNPTKDGSPRIFKGSVFATYSDIETAKKLAEIQSLKYKDLPIINKMQDQYMVDKKKDTSERRAAEKEVKQIKKKEVIDSQNKSTFQSFFIKGSVLLVDGFPNDTPIESVKEFFNKYGQAEYVKQDKNEKDQTQVWIKFIPKLHFAIILFNTNNPEY